MIEVGKDKYINTNIFWVFMFSYYVIFFILSIITINLNQPIFSENISYIIPYFIFNDVTDYEYKITNYYLIIVSLIITFNTICYIELPHIRRHSFDSIKVIFIFSITILFWLLGIFGFYYETRFFGVIPTAFIHATWLPAANVISIIFNIENGKKFTTTY